MGSAALFPIRLRYLACALLAFVSINASAADTVADPLVFTTVSNAEPGSEVTSNTQTVSGIDSSVPIRVAGGLYSINGGAFTSASGTVVNGSTVQLRLTASSAFDTTIAAKLVLGTPSASYAFKVTTRKVDTVPNAFTFGTVSQAVLGSTHSSEPATITGIEAPAPITVTGGSYSVDGVAFTTAAGTVGNNAQIRVLGTAGNSPKQTTTVEVKVGGVPGTFKITTVKVVDITPDAFSFAPVLDAEPFSNQVSQPIAVSGITGPAAVAITAGRYSINGGPPTTALGTVNNGDSVVLALRASNRFATTTAATLTIGGVSADFPVTTRMADTAPEPFAFAPVTEVLRSSLVTSAPITITGIDASAPVTVSGGQYSVNGAPFTGAAGTISNGQTVSVQVLAAPIYAVTTSATLTIGGISADFSVTTSSADTSPDPFSFIDNSAAFPLLAAPSNPITVSGITAAVTVSVTGGEYSVNGAPYLAVPGPVVNGDVLRVLVVPGPNNGDVGTATLRVGDFSAVYHATTHSPADDFPDLYQFDEVRAPVNSEVFSEPTHIRGINIPASISVAGGSYSINGGPFTTTSSMVKGGDILVLKAVTGSVYNVTQLVGTSIGGFGQKWTIKTQFDPTKLEPYTLTPATTYYLGYSLPGSVQLTKPVIVRNPPGGLLPIAVAGGSYSINGGPFTAAVGSVVDGDSVVVQSVAASTYNTTTMVTLRIGSLRADLTYTSILDPVASTPTAFPGCESRVYRDLTPVPMRLFVCYPPGWTSSDHRSAMMLWFGGAFQTGAPDRSIEEVQYWSSMQGMVGIAPDYRVNDRFANFAYVANDDGRAALKWIEENAASLGIDPTRVVVNGTSSGGQVAFFAAVRDAVVTGDPADNPPLRPAAVVSRAGSPDTTEEAEVHDNATLARFNGYATAISPSEHLDSAFPPTLIIHGDRDEKAGPTPGVVACSNIVRQGRICQFDSKAGIGHGLSSPNNTPIVEEDTRMFLIELGLLPAMQ